MAVCDSIEAESCQKKVSSHVYEYQFRMQFRQSQNFGKDDFLALAGSRLTVHVLPSPHTLLA